jgi:hypothetical protein
LPSVNSEEDLRLQLSLTCPKDVLKTFKTIMRFLDVGRIRLEHRLRVFENRLLRRIFGHKRDCVPREWRKLNNEELHNIYSTQNIIMQIMSKVMRWVGHVELIGEERKMYKVLVRNPERKRPLGRSRRR